MDAHALWDHVARGVWLRFHAVDPQWVPGPLVGSDGGGLRWERLAGWQRGDPRWQIERLDTTDEAPGETAARLEAWLSARRREHDENRLPLSGAWWQDEGSAA